MSDTEEVTITRKPRAVKDTKPEIAREKLKEKRERLKREKEEKIIEEAKKRLVEEEGRKKAEAEAKVKAEEEKKNTDPMFLVMKRMEEMMNMMRPAPAPEPVKKTTRKKKVEEDIEEPPITIKKPSRKKKDDTPELPKPTATKQKVEKVVVPKKARKPRQVTVYEESPSNIYVGDDRDPPPQQTYYPTESYQEVQIPTNPLLNKLMGRRAMNTFM